MSGGNLSIFVPINKIDEEQRLVYGQVAAEVMDNSGEVFDYEGSKPFFQKWSDNAHITSGGKSKGNLRVMHTSKVAGVVTDLGFDDDNRVIEACAKVVDDAEWNMVKAGGYTGFSMGGRYVSRAEKADANGKTQKTYVADPVEISLVDKPCIPTAVFSVVKADGLSETRRFRDDLYEKADTMYEPTNDEMLPVAKELAKAAGKTEDDWLDFMDAARADLIAKADGGEGAPQSEVPAENTDAPAQADEGDDAEKADKPFPPKKKDEEEGKEGEGDDDDKSGSDDEEEEEDEGEEAKKSDAPKLEQGWRADDGTFFVKKADAVAHNEALQKAANPGELSVVEQLRAVAADAEKIAKGEIEVETSEEEAEVEKSDVEKMADTFDAILKIDHGGTLAKTMYTVERTARLLREMASLNIAVSQEAKREGDGSMLPGNIGVALGQMGQVLIDMAKEEVEELLVSVAAEDRKDLDTPCYYDSYCELAASTLGLEKSDLLAKTEETLQKRDPAPVADDTLQKLDDANKRADEAVAKADKLQSEMDEIGPLVKSLQTQIEEIKKLPQPKAPTTSHAVGKGEQINQGGGGQIDLSKADPGQLADAAIRLAQSRPTHIRLPGAPGA